MGDFFLGPALVEAMKNVAFAGMSGYVQLDANGDRWNDVEVR